MLDAFHLPALTHVPTTTWSYGRGTGGVELRVPQLTPALLQTQVDALEEARAEHLARRPVMEIAAVLGSVAERFLDAGDPLRRDAETALPAVTGYSPPMVRTILDHMAADWRTPRLCELLQAEFGEPAVLDGFRTRPHRAGRARAYGPRLAFHVFSGNVPGVSVTSLIRSLLVKSATLGKSAAGEPLLAALFARGVAEADPELGACLSVAYWPGGAEELEQVALSAADAVVVYGGVETVESVRARTPAAVRFLPYSHRLSFGVVAREALSAECAERTARRAALQVATFDQQGCVSPHLFYAEEGGDVDPAGWAELLAAAMERVEGVLPRGAISPGEAADIRQLRGEVEFAQIAERGTVLHASARGTSWTVIFDPEPAFAASCLNRVVRVKPVADLADVPCLVGSVSGLLQSVGVAVPEERLVDLADEFGRLGASRITPLGQMAWPPPHWHHDGQPPLRALVRWCDLEGPSS